MLPTSLDWHRAFVRQPDSVQLMVLDTRDTPVGTVPDIELIVDGLHVGAHAGDRGQYVWVLLCPLDTDGPRGPMARIPMWDPDTANAAQPQLRPVADIIDDIVAEARRMAAAR